MTNTALKAQIDAAITSKTTPSSISPSNVGTNIKAVIDYVDQFNPADNSTVVHLTTAETITGSKTFTTSPSTPASIIVNNVVGNNGLNINTHANAGINIDNIGGGDGLVVTNETFGNGIKTTNTSGVGITTENLGVGTGILIDNGDAGIGLKINSFLDGKGLVFTNEGTGYDIFIDNIGGDTTIPITVRKGGNVKFLVQDTGNVTATQYKLSTLNSAPATSTSTGILGEIRVTSTAIYVCTATNTWVKANLATF